MKRPKGKQKTAFTPHLTIFFDCGAGPLLSSFGRLISFGQTWQGLQAPPFTHAIEHDDFSDIYEYFYNN